MRKTITKEQLKKMQQGRKAKGEIIFIYEDENYKIEKIPLNYRIIIKCAKRHPSQGMENDWYSNLEHGEKEAHATAEFAIKEYFIKDKKPEIPKQLEYARKCIGKNKSSGV